MQLKPNVLLSNDHTMMCCYKVSSATDHNMQGSLRKIKFGSRHIAIRTSKTRNRDAQNHDKCNRGTIQFHASYTNKSFGLYSDYIFLFL
jgi:hypothetical protein